MVEKRQARRGKKIFFFLSVTSQALHSKFYTFRCIYTSAPGILLEETHAVSYFFKILSYPHQGVCTHLSVSLVFFLSLYFSLCFLLHAWLDRTYTPHAHAFDFSFFRRRQRETNRDEEKERDTQAGRERERLTVPIL